MSIYMFFTNWESSCSFSSEVFKAIWQDQQNKLDKVFKFFFANKSLKSFIFAPMPWIIVFSYLQLLRIRRVFLQICSGYLQKTPGKFYTVPPYKLKNLLLLLVFQDGGAHEALLFPYLLVLQLIFRPKRSCLEERKAQSFGRWRYPWGHAPPFARLHLWSHATVCRFFGSRSVGNPPLAFLIDPFFAEIHLGLVLSLEVFVWGWFLYRF